MTLYVAAIVEGEGKQRCLPRLLHRVWGELLLASERLHVEPPFRKPRSNIVRQDHLAKFVSEAYLKVQQAARKDSAARLLVLILADAEDDCPKEVAPKLIGWAKGARADADIVCIMPNPMYETWFAAGVASLAGINGLPSDITEPDGAEANRLGKGWLKKHLQQKYKETVDQPAFTARMDLSRCRLRSPSFDKLCRELEARLPLPPPWEGATDETPPTVPKPAVPDADT
jgi:hypothetical protein